jgi:hypothetical protein
MSWFVNTLSNDAIVVPTTFVETGTYLGHGVESAISTNHFKTIYSIDISEEFQCENRKKFAQDQSVHILTGNSPDVLEELIQTKQLPNSPVLFFLDAHFAGGPTGGANIDGGCPVVREVSIIGERGVQGDIIVIDDMRHIGQARWGGIDGHEMYPRTWLDFRHASVEAIGNALSAKGRTIQITKYYDTVDRLLIII